MKKVKLWAYYELDGTIHNITTDEAALRATKRDWSSARIIEIDGTFSVSEIPNNSSYPDNSLTKIRSAIELFKKEGVSTFNFLKYQETMCDLINEAGDIFNDDKSEFDLYTREKIEAWFDKLIAFQKG